MQGIRHSSRVVAVLGTGSAGLRHLAALQMLPGVLPVAVPRRRERRAELQAMGYATAATLAEAIKDLNVSHCIVASDTSRHVYDGLAALASGLPTLVEKPLSVDAAGGRQLWLQAQRDGVGLRVACVMRFSQSLQAFRSWLPKIGEVASVRIECQSYLPDWRPNRPYRDSYSARPAEGGVLRDLIHEIDYAGWLFGWPAQLHARLDHSGRLGIDVEEAADLLWRTSTGAAVSMRLDYVTKPSRRRMTACGAGGVLEWDALRNTVTLQRADGSAEDCTEPQSREAMFAAQADAFIEAVSGGSDDDRLATGLEGVRALALCDAARRADASRREEPVEYL